MATRTSMRVKPDAGRQTTDDRRQTGEDGGQRAEADRHVGNQVATCPVAGRRGRPPVRRSSFSRLGVALRRSLVVLRSKIMDHIRVNRLPSAVRRLASGLWPLWHWYLQILANLAGKEIKNLSMTRHR